MVAAPIDWAAVDTAFGRSGAMPAGDVPRFGMPRSDLNVTSQGVRIMTSLALRSWIAMKQSGSGPVIAMGDLVLLEDELNRKRYEELTPLRATCVSTREATVEATAAGASFRRPNSADASSR
jgi:hypothetical protein